MRLIPHSSRGSAWRVLVLVVLAVLAVGCLGLEKTEAEWLASTTYSKGQAQMIYVFVTNRPASQTHPSPSPAPSPSIASPQPVPSPLTSTPSPTPSPTNTSNPAPSKKRDVDMLEMIQNGTNSTNSTPSDVPAPDGTGPSPLSTPTPVSPPAGNGTSPPVSPAPPIILPDDLYLKAIFLPGVDNLALLKIPELAHFNNTAVYEAYRAKYPDLAVYVQYGNGTTALKSPRKRFWALNKIVGSFSALVSLNNGIVTAISWDDGCYECDADHCLEDNCTIEPIDCTGHRCSLKVYLGWVGTDSQGLYCSSAGQLPSAYRTFSFGRAFLYAANAVQNTALTIIGSVQYK